MRPGTESPTPRPRRKSSVTEPDGHTAHGVPTTFFLASESDMQNAMSGQPQAALSGAGVSSKDEETKTGDKDNGGSFGVQRIGDALTEAFGDKRKTDKEEEPEEQGNDGIYRLFRRKRKLSKTDTLPETTKSQDEVEVRNQSPSAAIRNVSPSKPARQNPAAPSQPLTPLLTGNHTPFDSAPPSTPKSGSLRSLRLSDEDDGLTEDNTSQAIAPSDDEDAEDEDQSRTMQNMSSSMPELVMPSLSMPSRRPFTPKGRAMGRLKVAVAGARGVGKSSLIRAIVQQCEDIVHVDPVFSSTPTISSSQQSKAKRKGRIGDAVGNLGVVEIHASTKSYPAWWSDIEESRILRRRKSMEDAVLERNICFVDSPPLHPNSPNSTTHPLTKYMEVLLHKNASISAMNDNELLNVLSGSGGVQVDVVLYVFASPSELSRDIDFCRRITNFSSIIPVITKTDTMESKDLASFKLSVLRELQSGSIKPFLFGTTLEDAISQLISSSMQTPAPEADSSPSIQPQEEPTTDLPATPSVPSTKEPTLPPFAITTAPGSDDSEMDASLLMSPSYNPPLLPSELTDLITLLFEPENMAWLRHSAVRKFLTWRAERLAMTGIPSGGDSLIMHGSPLSVTRALQQRQSPTASPTNGTPSASQTLIPRKSDALSPFNLSSSALGAASGLSDFTRARLRDHTLREERLAQLQLQTWAADLQRTVALEKQCYRELVQAERATWLLERVGEEVRVGRVGVLDASGPGTAVAVAKRGSAMDVAPWARTLPSSSRAPKPQDADLPRWARARHRRRHRRAAELDVTDPLGVCAWQDSVYHGLATSLRLLGGGVMLGAAYLAVASAWYRMNGNGSEFLALSHAEGESWVSVGGQAPRWVGAAVARWIWGWGVEVRYV